MHPLWNPHTYQGRAFPSPHKVPLCLPNSPAPRRQPPAHLSPPARSSASSGTSWDHAACVFRVWLFPISRMPVRPSCVVCIDSCAQAPGGCPERSHTATCVPLLLVAGLGVVPFGDIINKAATNIHVQTFLCTCALTSFKKTSASGSAGLEGGRVLYFVGNFPQSSCNVLCSLQPCLSTPVVAQPSQHGEWPVF